MFDEPGFRRSAQPDDAWLPLLHHVVYCSRAADGVDDADDIREVLRDALDTAEDPNNVAALNRILGQLDSGPLQALGRD